MKPKQKRLLVKQQEKDSMDIASKEASRKAEEDRKRLEEARKAEEAEKRAKEVARKKASEGQKKVKKHKFSPSKSPSKKQ